MYITYIFTVTHISYITVNYFMYTHRVRIKPTHPPICWTRLWVPIHMCSIRGGESTCIEWSIKEIINLVIVCNELVGKSEMAVKLFNVIKWAWRSVVNLDPICRDTEVSDFWLGFRWNTYEYIWLMNFIQAFCRLNGFYFVTKKNAVTFFCSVTYPLDLAETHTHTPL